MTQREIEIPEFPFPGGLSQAGHWLAASARLDAGYLPGGSNTRQTLAKLCRSIAHELDETAVEPTISPHEPEVEWHKFDKDDETNYPPENQIRYWTVTEGEVLMRQWLESPRAWQNVTYWQPIPVPSPPESEES